MAGKSFLLISHNARSHINPTLHFATKLLSLGAKVTLLITASAARTLDKDQLPDGLILETFSEDAVKFSGIEQWLSEYERLGRLALRDLLASSADAGRPFVCVVHTLLMPWVVDVAAERHVPTAALWIQSATVFNVFYCYFNGYGDLIRRNKDNPSFSVQLPGLPELDIRDLPSIITSEKDSSLLKTIEEILRTMEKINDLPILINTFDELEHDAMSEIGRFNFIPVGPLFSYVDQSGASFGRPKQNYMKWLDSKPDSSVVYVAFGSLYSLSKKEIEEIAGGLLECGYPFLWIVRLDAMEEKLSCLDELEAQGKMEPWCSQVEVLRHRSVGCFVTHGGWNSTVESVAAGVPVVGCPQWADQSTNCKMMEDVWKMGVKAKSNGEGVVEGKELSRCLKLLMDSGEKGKKMRMAAKKWRHSAEEAAAGCSDLNLKAFVDGICPGNSSITKHTSFDLGFD